jgi:glutathione-specific gamma-glutamylcyclotransferase
LDQIWVFAYGSLIWDPGFTPAEQVAASLTGYHRSFCMKSVAYRGTARSPGLVLALDAQAGAICRGLALRVAEGEATAVVAALRARELNTSAYREMTLPITLADGRQVRALTYVIDPVHDQYCRHDQATQAAIIARSSGERGLNRDYLFNTVAHLDQLGLGDPDLTALVAAVQGICGEKGPVTKN